jgi:hypothetical protein
MVYFLKCKESAPTTDSAVHGFLKKGWQLKFPNRAAVTDVDYPAVLSVIAPYPAGLLFPLFLPQDTVHALTDFLRFFHFLFRSKISRCSPIMDLNFSSSPTISMMLLACRKFSIFAVSLRLYRDWEYPGFPGYALRDKML